MYDEFKKDHPHVVISYSKFVSMKQTAIQPMSKNKLMTCLCEYCVNMELKIEALKTIKKRKARRGDVQSETEDVPVDKFKLTTCENATKKCFDRMCDRCGISNVNDTFTKLTNGETKLTNGEEKVSWLQWEVTKYRNSAGKETVRMMKVTKEAESHVFCES